MPEPETIWVMGRANLTLEGGISLVVDEVKEIPNTAEAQACAVQQLLVIRAADGTFADLGPLRPVNDPPTGCCGGGRR